jgi:hypothetical protein
MGRKPLYSSTQPLPDTPGPRYGAFVLAAVTLIVVVLGTALGTGMDQNVQSPQNLDEGESNQVIPNTGMDSQDSVNKQRQSMRCTVRGGPCPPSEAGER